MEEQSPPLPELHPQIQVLFSLPKGALAPVAAAVMQRLEGFVQGHTQLIIPAWLLKISTGKQGGVKTPIPFDAIN